LSSRPNAAERSARRSRSPKAYVEARKHHGESELLDEIVSAKPEIDHTRYHSAEELEEHGLQHLRDAVELLEQEATPEELDDYKRFVLNVADKVANAHREGGENVSADERLKTIIIGRMPGFRTPIRTRMRMPLRG
jgi:hypothetical protein